MKVISFINNYITKMGAQLTRYPEDNLRRRLKLIEHFGINKIFDVGANVGNYAIVMRKLGFKGNIISFEPLTSAFKSLKQNAQKYSNWETVNIALGRNDDQAFINVAGNSDSSSLLEMLPDHLKSAPQSSYIGKEKITVRKVDSIINDYYKNGDRIFLKIDTQGFEKEVLEGSLESLSKIVGIQLEMSIIPLYNGGILFCEMIDFLKTKGFHIYSLENGFSDPETGRLLQMDGIFFR